ncbi:hypothetical protein SBA3_3760007 [Candidatus Sulfopaludibacter sp. SbA3]|nr:hypothetical protein SBA3_3760007 [Candidatus Sulfopaludibacter sp. SbA3]
MVQQGKYRDLASQHGRQRYQAQGYLWRRLIMRSSFFLPGIIS